MFSLFSIRLRLGHTKTKISHLPLHLGIIFNFHMGVLLTDYSFCLIAMGHDRFLPLELFVVADLPSRSAVC